MEVGFVSDLQVTNCNSLKIKLSLFSIKPHSLKVCWGGGMGVTSHILLTWAYVVSDQLHGNGHFTALKGD